MSVSISKILPKKEYVIIPITILNPETMEYEMESITVFSPTVERVEAFNNQLVKGLKNEEILILLIEHFTDIAIDMDKEAMGNFQEYFSEIFDTLTLELYRILTVVIKHGLQAKNMIADMDDSYFDELEKTGIENFQELKKIKETIKKG